MEEYKIRVCPLENPYYWEVAVFRNDDLLTTNKSFYSQEEACSYGRGIIEGIKVARGEV